MSRFKKINQLVLIVASLVFVAAKVNASECEIKKNALEIKLLENPENEAALLAYMLVLQSCDLIQEPAQPEVPQSKISGRLNFSYGYNTNPENNADRDQFILTMDDQSFPIENNQKPKPSNFHSVSNQLTFKQSSHQVNLLTETRRYDLQTIASQTTYALDYYYIRNRTLYELNLAQVRYQNTYYNEYGAGFSYMLSTDVIGKLSLQKRNFKNYPILNSTTYRLDFFPARITLPNKSGVIFLRLGYLYNTPDTSRRAGGDYDTINLNIGYRLEKQKHHWQINLHSFQQQDEKGYSEFINNQIARKINQNAIQAQWVYSITKNYGLSASYSQSWQKSNIELFEWKGQQWRIGFDLAW